MGSAPAKTNCIQKRHPIHMNQEIQCADSSDIPGFPMPLAGDLIDLEAVMISQFIFMPKPSAGFQPLWFISFKYSIAVISLAFSKSSFSYHGITIVLTVVLLPYRSVPTETPFFQNVQTPLFGYKLGVAA